MTKTKRKKRFSKERGVCNPDSVCLKCGNPMKGASHHYFCNDCYVPGLLYTPEMQKKKEELKRKMGEKYE